MALSDLSTYQAQLGVKPEKHLAHQYVAYLKLLALMPARIISQQVATWNPVFGLQNAIPFTDGYAVGSNEFQNANHPLASLVLSKYRLPNFVPGTVRDASGGTALEDFQMELVRQSGDGIFARIANDVFVGTGSSSTGPTVVGIDAALAVSGVYGGIDKAAVPDWRGNVVTSVGSLTISKMRDAIQAHKNKNVFAPTVLVGSPTTAGLASALADQQVRYGDNINSSLGLNTASMTVLGIPFLEMAGCPEGKIYMLDLSTWELQVLPHRMRPEDKGTFYMTKPLTMHAGDWAAEDTSLPIHVAPLAPQNGFSSFYDVFTPNFQLVCRSPRRNTVLTGITA